ncbi:hypothetical protein E4U21_001374 [Claviceps maximensis]|nr:hypothetical protein E4U21_001374 [Claviceps maximensis]
MPPRKRGRGHAAFTPIRSRNSDAMDVDTPTTSQVGAATPSRKRERPHYNEMWTDDQVASLFKGVIRWKPAGMHKHFRMIAISEHLRNHGFDPDLYKHTRIPHIWNKLRTYYDLDIIDEREHYDHDELDQKYVDFSLPRSDFLGSMMRRAVADTSEAPTSPPELDLSAEPPQTRKRKRSSTTALKARSIDAEDTDEGQEDTPLPVIRPTRGTRGGARGARGTRGSRGSRGRARTVSQGRQAKMEENDKMEKTDKAETTEEEEQEEEEDEDDDDDDENSEEENHAEDARDDDNGSGSDERGEESPEEEGGTPASRSTRAAARKNSAPKPTARRTRSRR